MAISPLEHATPLLQLKSAGREVEIKFLLTDTTFKEAQHWERLGAPASRRRAQRFRSVYFDTANGDLQRHQAVLRVRHVNRRHILTFKWNGSFAGGGFERGEVEVPSISEIADPALLGTEIAGLIEGICDGLALQPVFETDVKRVTYLVHAGVSDIEVAFDKGLVVAGARSCSIREVEMELKSGQPADLYDLGISLTEAFAVSIGCQSKAERGALLLSGAPPAIFPAPRTAANAPNVDEAIGLSLNSCVSHFLGNWPAYQTGDRGRAVHQMRVALRRMRSIIGVFQRSFPCAEFVQFRQQAKSLAAILGGARDWDVFIDLMCRGPIPVFPNEAGFSLLRADAEQHRDAAYKTASAMLAATDTSRFVLSMQSFMARHGWRNGPSGETLPDLTAPSDGFFAQHLARLHRKIVKGGKNFHRMTPVQRHELRKQLKKLRYFVDLFSDLFEMRTENKAYIRAVSALQDQLGMLNDLSAAEDMVAKLNTGGDHAAIRAAGITIGWCGRGATADDFDLGKAWKRFRKLRPIA